MWDYDKYILFIEIRSLWIFHWTKKIRDTWNNHLLLAYNGNYKDTAIQWSGGHPRQSETTHKTLQQRLFLAEPSTLLGQATQTNGRTDGRTIISLPMERFKCLLRLEMAKMLITLMGFNIVSLCEMNSGHS